MISRRRFLRAVGAGAAALAIADPSRAAEADSDRPNIVFILVDDQRNDTLGCAGHKILNTPVVDSLAAKGVRFSNMFVTTSICAASRASIFTGLHERTHGYTFGKPAVSKAHTEASYPVLLRKAGYRTGFIGKYGVNMAGGRAQMFDSFESFYGPRFIKQPDGSKRHTAEICGDKAIKFIQAGKTDSGAQKKPFCLSISFPSVHAVDGNKKPGDGHYPWPKAVDGMYDDVKIPPPRLSESEIFNNHPEFLKKSMNRHRWFWRWDTPEKYQTNIRAYYRMISGVDRVIGRVVEELKTQGLDKNTVIIYTGDNGYYMGQRGFAGKWSHYEESLRVPLVIYDPRPEASKRGKVDDAVALNIDLTATMLDLAGITPPKHYGGRPLTAMLKGAAPADWRTDFFCEHLMERHDIPKWEGVRGPRYVYARYFGQKPQYEFLHDLKTDPDQLKNFASDPKYADTLKKMQTRCDELRETHGGPYKRPAAKRKKKKARG
ncbi:MAG: sulfatase [Phycisphaerae bacterium]|nr:sulfatase [Phycisphaerae bacterium]